MLSTPKVDHIVTHLFGRIRSKAGNNRFVSRFFKILYPHYVYRSTIMRKPPPLLPGEGTQRRNDERRKRWHGENLTLTHRCTPYLCHVPVCRYFCGDRGLRGADAEVRAASQIRGKPRLRKWRKGLRQDSVATRAAGVHLENTRTRYRDRIFRPFRLRSRFFNVLSTLTWFTVSSERCRTSKGRIQFEVGLSFFSLSFFLLFLKFRISSSHFSFLHGSPFYHTRSRRFRKSIMTSHVRVYVQSVQYISRCRWRQIRGKPVKLG